MHDKNAHTKSGTYTTKQGAGTIKLYEFSKIRQRNKAPHTFLRGMTTGRPPPLPHPRHLTILLAVNTTTQHRTLLQNHGPCEKTTRSQETERKSLLYCTKCTIPSRVADEVTRGMPSCLYSSTQAARHPLATD